MDNLEAKYNYSVAEKIDEIRKQCNALKIPCFMAFGVSQDEEGNYKLRGNVLLPELFGYDSKDSRFADFVNVQNGFRTIPPEAEYTDIIDSDEFMLPKGFGGFGEDA
ncbi:MAG: hypothetical protein LUE86_07555 [Clostridiales bacterium]|nr:hypothetical protein [Clostridiales bacterium]